METLEQGKLTKYVKYIEQMLDELGDDSQDDYATSLELAAAFLKMTMKKTVMGASKDIKAEDLNYGTSAGLEAYEGDTVRLFINVGKKDNLQINDLVKFIATNTSIEGKSIGKVDLLEKNDTIPCCLACLNSPSINLI